MTTTNGSIVLALATCCMISSAGCRVEGASTDEAPTGQRAAALTDPAATRLASAAATATFTLTNACVFAMTFITVAADALGPNSTGVNVSYFVSDSCAQSFRSGSGVLALAAVTFPKDLSSYQLTAAIPVNDTAFGPVSMALDVSWSARGPLPRSAWISTMTSA
jgi:hypothetical protein